ncbi:hypothetical protein [Streptomyces sp. NPDC058424]|uniref:hypothetical protein n=1 Tax=Streptomyces sp. NPDC058424 TaxID=3346491 RepID=UPI003656D829
MPAEAREAPDVAVRLVRELHRRQQRYDSGPAEWTEFVRVQVHGELIGLRSALGIALGHEPTSIEALPAAMLFYDRWLSEGMPEVMPP